jgi:hypothetical protein
MGRAGSLIACVGCVVWWSFRGLYRCMGMRRCVGPGSRRPSSWRCGRWPSTCRSPSSRCEGGGGGFWIRPFIRVLSYVHVRSCMMIWDVTPVDQGRYDSGLRQALW